MGPFLVLVFGRIYKEAEMQILCCLHDNHGFVQLGKVGGRGNRGWEMGPKKSQISHVGSRCPVPARCHQVPYRVNINSSTPRRGKVIRAGGWSNMAGMPPATDSYSFICTCTCSSGFTEGPDAQSSSTPLPHGD